MIIAWHVTKRNAHLFLDEISVFDGIAFVSPHQPSKSSPEQRFSDEMRQEIVYQLPREVESDHHIWIACERHGTMYSFLRAQVLSGQEAQVDLLCAVKWGYNWQTHVYEGFGELEALFMLLEQRGMRRCSLPLTLDMNCRALSGSGWFEQGQGVYRKATEGRLFHQEKR
jgi:hypothetical protein